MRLSAALIAASVMICAGPAVAADPERPGTWRQAAAGEQHKACPKPTWPAGDPSAAAPGKGRRVLLLGDSLTRYAYSPLRRRLQRDGWLPTIVCWGGMQANWGLANAKDVARRRYLPDRVVVGFGANDVHRNPCTDDCDRHVHRFGRRVDRLLTYLGPDRQVWWLNIDMDADRAARVLGEPWNRNFPAFNRELRRVVARHPSAQLIDWRAIVRTSPTPISYSADGLHYAPLRPARSSAGSMLRVRTIVRTLRVS